MIKGVLFDKDGTLIDFFDLWGKAAFSVIPAFIRENRLKETEEMKQYLFKTIGINNGKIEPDGALAYKSYNEIAADINEALKLIEIYIPKEMICEQILFLFSAYISRPEVEFKPLFHLEKVFQYLKDQGIFIGLATADTLGSAENCLQALGVRKYFDYVGADDGKMLPKPAPDMLMRFAQNAGIFPEEIAVVGDTYNDIRFARQCSSISVGVLSGVSKVNDFYGEADYILDTAADIVKVCEEQKGRIYYGADSIRACV